MSYKCNVWVGKSSRNAYEPITIGTCSLGILWHPPTTPSICGKNQVKFLELDKKCLLFIEWNMTFNAIKNATKILLTRMACRTLTMSFLEVSFGEIAGTIIFARMFSSWFIWQPRVTCSFINILSRFLVRLFFLTK